MVKPDGDELCDDLLVDELLGPRAGLVDDDRAHPERLRALVDEPLALIPRGDENDRRAMKKNPPQLLPRKTLGARELVWNLAEQRAFRDRARLRDRRRVL